MSLLWLLSLFATIAIAQDAWVNPPGAGKQYYYAENQVWPLGSTQTLKWESPEQTADIWMYQELKNKGVYGMKGYIARDVVNKTEFEYVVTETFFDIEDRDSLPVFFLGLQTRSDIGRLYETTSEYINITRDEAYVAPAPSTTSRGSILTISTSWATATNSESTTSGSSSGEEESGRASRSSRISTGAAVGITIATILGVVSGAVGFWFWFRRRRDVDRTDVVAELYTNEGKMTYPYRLDPPKPVELGGQRTAGAELE